MELVEVEIIGTGERAWLPASVVYVLQRQHRVRLVGVGSAPWLQRRGPTIADSWDRQQGRFTPGPGLTVR